MGFMIFPGVEGKSKSAATDARENRPHTDAGQCQQIGMVSGYFCNYLIILLFYLGGG